MDANKKKILMVGPVPPPFGGIAAVISDLITSDLKEEFTFDVFNRSEIPVNGFWHRWRFRFRRMLTFFRQARSRNYCFAHIHSADPVFTGTVIFVVLAKLAGIKTLVHLHGTDWDDFYTRRGLLYQTFIRMGLGLFDQTIVLYKLWLDNIREIEPKAQVTVIRNLIPEPSIVGSNAIQTLRNTLGLEKNALVVITVGSLGHRKGIFDIIKAVPDVISKNPNVCFVLVGGEEVPGEFQQVVNFHAESSCKPNILLIGEVERSLIPVYLQMADVFLLPSYVEGMPISIIEAMAHKKAVITTAVGGIPELIKHEQSGLIVDPGKPDQIADAVLRLAEDQILRQKVGQNAFVEFQDKYEFSKGIEEMRQVYRSIC